MDTLEKLKLIIDSYAENKAEVDAYKSICEKQNKNIKDIMRNENLEEFNTGSIIAKFSKNIKEDFDEELLIIKLKQLMGDKCPCIKTVEVVDMDYLEDLIYNGDLDAKELISCKTSKIIERLNIKKAKSSSN